MKEYFILKFQIMNWMSNERKTKYLNIKDSYCGPYIIWISVGHNLASCNKKKAADHPKVAIKAEFNQLSGSNVKERVWDLSIYKKK